jgi:hypothetical protein
MDRKLTLKLNQEVIERAKQYASDKKLSLSRIIENYLSSLTSEKTQKSEIEISPFVKSLTKGIKYAIPADYDYKKERIDYLEKKHK